MTTIIDSIHSLHDSPAICDCCGYHLTKKEIASGTMYCFDCVNEEEQESIGTIEYNANQYNDYQE